MTDHGLASYLSRVLDLPWETDSRLEELLQLACENLGVHSVSLETPTDKVTVLTPGSSWDTAEDQEVKNPNETLREALAIGLDLSRHRLVAYAVATDGSPWGENAAGLLEQLVNERLKASLCVWLDRGVAVLADLAAMSAREVHEAFGTIVEDARLARARLVVGGGSRCEGPADYSRSWREARLAAQFAAYRQHPAVVEIDELGAFSLFAHADLESRLGADVGLLLGPLQDMNAPMVETLDAYVHSGFSVEDAAQLLHVHPNTLRYRIRRLQERFDMDLSHGDQRFLLELGLRVRRLMAGDTGTDAAP